MITNNSTNIECQDNSTITTKANRHSSTGLNKRCFSMDQENCTCTLLNFDVFIGNVSQNVFYKMFMVKLNHMQRKKGIRVVPIDKWHQPLILSKNIMDKKKSFKIPLFLIHHMQTLCYGICCFITKLQLTQIVFTIEII